MSVLIEPTKGRARTLRVDARLAAALVRTGRFRLHQAEAPDTPALDLAGLPYWELRRLVAERGIEVGSIKKADLVQALTAAGR